MCGSSPGLEDSAGDEGRDKVEPLRPGRVSGKSRGFVGERSNTIHGV